MLAVVSSSLSTAIVQVTLTLHHKTFVDAHDTRPIHLDADVAVSQNAATFQHDTRPHLRTNAHVLIGKDTVQIVPLLLKKMTQH